MVRTTLRGLAARKRRLVGTSLSIVLGVGFLLATLVLGDTMRATFTDIFTEANAGTDVVVRDETTFGADDERVRGDLDATIVDQVAAVPGIAAAEGLIEGTVQIVDADGDPIGGDGPPTFGAGWLADEQLNPYVVEEGRAPAAADEVVVDETSAETAGFEVGDTITVQTPDPLQVELVGIVRFGDQSSMAGATYVGFTPAQAAEVLGKDGVVTDVRARGDGSISSEALRDAVATVLPDGVEAITGAELATEQQDAIESDFLGFVTTFLLVFAGIALLVAVFSIHNTFTILLAQRTRESALLRAIGASRRQVLGGIALEAVAIGLVASALGLAAGYGLAIGLAGLFSSFGMDLAQDGLDVQTDALAIAFVVGLLATVVASVVPAVRAARVAPMEALRETAAEPPRLSVIRTVIGALVLAGGIAVVAIASADGAIPATGAGAALVLVGAVALAPSVARPVASLLGRPAEVLRGQPGRLARLNSMRNPRRTAGSAMALLIGTAVVALFATFGASVRTSIDRTVDRSFGGDLVVAQEGFSGAGISEQLQPTVAALPEVERSVGLANATVEIDGEAQYPTVAEPADLGALLDLDVQDGSIAEVGPGELAVSTAYAEANDLQVGSELSVGYVDGGSAAFTVAATYAEDGLIGDVVMTPGDWAPHATRAGHVAVLVDLADGVGLEDGRGAVQVVADRLGAPDVEDRDQYIDRVAGEVDQLLTLIYGLLALAIVIALMGLANTLSLSIHERTTELGLLRAVGLTKGQLRATVRWESVITAVLGTVLGLGLGTFLGWALVRAMAAEESFVAFSLPNQTLAMVLVLAVAAGVIAALRPARRAARLDVLDAIATP